MFVVAGGAVLLALGRSFRPASGHPGYWLNRAVNLRREEGWARQWAAAARSKAADVRRTIGTAGASEEQPRRRAEQYEEKAARHEQFADQCSREAVYALNEARAAGYVPSRLPEYYRQKLKPEDLRP